MQRVRIRGETARRQGGAVPEDGDVQTDSPAPRGCGAWAAVVKDTAGSIGHTRFHQASPHETPPMATCPLIKLFEEACADTHWVVWRQAMDKQFNGLADNGIFGET